MSDNGRPPANGGWFWLHNGAADQQADVGLTAWGVYGQLARMADNRRQCWPSTVLLAERCGVTKRCVLTAVRRLERAGWLTVTRKPGAPNRYTLLAPPGGEANDTTTTGGGERNDPGVVNETTLGVVNETHPEQDPIEEDPRNKTQKGTKAKPKRARPEDVPVPDALDTPEFHAAWGDWLGYRRERGLTLTPRTLTGQLRKLAELGPTEAAREIQKSMDNGWQSVVYESKGSTNGRDKNRSGPGQRHPADVRQVGMF